ncbi:hypothetical protein ACFVH6_44530 [Spirillospora sp. NPDC127200]
MTRKTEINQVPEVAMPHKDAWLLRLANALVEEDLIAKVTDAPDTRCVRVENPAYPEWAARILLRELEGLPNAVPWWQFSWNERIAPVFELDKAVRRITERLTPRGATSSRDETAVRMRHLEALQQAIVARTGLRATIRQPGREHPYAVQVRGALPVLGSEFVSAAPLPDGAWAYWWHGWSGLIGLVTDLDSVVAAIERVLTPNRT